MNRIMMVRISISRIFVVLAGVLLIVTTACSAPKNEVQVPNSRPDVPAGLQAVPGKKNPRPEVPERAVTNTFQKSTMNEFSDVDPRAGETVSGKAKALIDNAKRNVIDQTGNLGENTQRTLDKKGENLEDFGKNLQRSAEDTKDITQENAKGFVKGTKQGTENIKDNTLDATKDVTRGTARTAEDLKQTVKANTPDAEDLTRGAKRATKDASNLVKDKADEAGESTSNFVQDKVNQVVKGTQKALDKAGNAVDDAVD